MTPKELNALASQLRELLNRVPASSDDLSTRQARAIRGELEAVLSEIRERLGALDPTKQPDSFFDPSDPRLFGVFAAIAMIGQDRVPLTSVENARFYGAGVYALYYTGKFKLYKTIAGTEHPIYVGKADPSQQYARTPQEQGAKLCSRLNEHRKNIVRASTTLSVGDFECRYLVVQSGYQGAAENALIGLFHPLWNNETKILYGFGKHGDAATTRANKRSPWDVLHPGRAWAGHSSLEDARSIPEIESDVRQHFGKYPSVPDLQHVLHELVAQIKRTR